MDKQENTTLEEQSDVNIEKKIMKFTKLNLTKKTKIIIAASVAVACIVYISVASYFQERFIWGTTVNGIDSSAMTTEEVEKRLQEQVEQYVLEIKCKDDKTEKILGTDIETKYVNGKDIEKAMEEQNPYGWFFALFKKKDVKTEVEFSYSEKALETKLESLQCMQKDSQKAPVNASLKYQDGSFVIIDEVPGTAIDEEAFQTAVKESVERMESSLDLDAAGCYKQPKFKADSEKVIKTQETLNKYLKTKVTYSLDSIEVTVDKELISKWISANEEMEPVISEKKVREFTDTLGKKYNTPNKSQVLVSPTGKKVTIGDAQKGRIVGSAAECKQLISEIKEGKTITREPILSQKPTSGTTYVWGNTYVEVDISAQHMWYISNGSVVFETDVVTGSPGRDTPAGVFQILTKKRNKTLRGNPMPNGELEYETPVDYWARITWSGVGFHDADWQEAFGGQRYKQGYGSHGCINMPHAAVAQFYNLISVGDPVIIHY